MVSRQIFIGMGALLICTAGGVMGAMNNVHPPQPAGPHRQPTAIIVACSPATVRPMSHSIVATGTISARDELSISAQASGLQIKSVFMDEGDEVKRGQVLCRLDDSILQAQLAEEKANLDNAKASYQKALQPNTQEELAIASSSVKAGRAEVQRNRFAVEKAKADAANTASIAQRYQYLNKEGGATDQEYQQKRTDAEESAAALQAAEDSLEESGESLTQLQERLKQMRRGGRSEDIEMARASVDQHIAHIQQLKSQIEQTYVRAPDDGLITSRDAHIGDISTSGRTLFKMARDQQLEMVANLAQDDLDALTLKQDVVITNGRKTAVGTVRLKAPTVDPQSRLGKIHVDVPAGRGFLEGMFVTATLHCNNRRTLSIPENAVQEGDGATQYVYLCSGETCHKTTVKTGDHTNGFVEILSGLKANDEVVTEGVTFVNDGDNVSVRQALSQVPQ